MLAKWGQGEGYRVAVLSRGYGGRYRAKVLEVSNGSRIKANFREVGDEPYLLARKLPGIPVVISKRRFLAGSFAHKRFGCDFLILDDGFQHLHLKRDLDLVLIDADTPFGNSHLLPWGPLREPVGQLCRARAFIVTRFKGDGASDQTLHLLKRRFPAMRVYCADHLADKVIFPHSDETHNPDFLKGKAVVAFAGIGRPKVFRDTLVKLGAELVYFKGFRDHYEFNREEIDSLIHVKEELGADYLLTTEKDWVRMAHLAPDCRELAYLSIKFVILSGEDDFFGMIKDGMGRAQN
jgi:tetraacyldisaccharide 4'-kinase